MLRLLCHTRELSLCSFEGRFDRRTRAAHRLELTLAAALATTTTRHEAWMKRYDSTAKTSYNMTRREV